MADTEYKLREWREGQVQAERLSAAVLHVEGYSSVDPQCPLGGPDGIKDLLCEKNGWKYVAAAYFPTKNKTFSEIKNKFIGDLKGVKKNCASGIVFLTNQPLTPTERVTLEKLAQTEDCKTILYHLERIRGIMDSPKGYGARLEYLGISMSHEDQLSFFSQWNNALEDKLHENSLMIIRELSRKIDMLSAPMERLGVQVEDISQIANRTRSLLAEVVEKSDKTDIPGPIVFTVTKNLTVEGLCVLHKALMVDMPSSNKAGSLRADEVWIGAPGSTKESAVFVPSPPTKINDELTALLERWSEKYSDLEQSEKAKVIAELTMFHHGLLRIHPFLDGNGRLARFLLSQQASELLGIRTKITLEDRLPYFNALQQADSGEYSDLEAHITQALFGVEFIAGSPCEMAGQHCPSCKEGIMDVSNEGAGVKCGKCGLFIPA